MDIRTAKNIWGQYRGERGFVTRPVPLLTPPIANLKFDRSAGAIYGLALAQSRTSGRNVCPDSTPNCVKACVAKNGNGAYNKVKTARIVKTTFMFAHPEAFSTLMVQEIKTAIKKHDGNVIFRLNTFSDIAWEETNPEFFEIEGAEFYDYTKTLTRPGLPNYRLTYSATERTTTEQIQSLVDAGSTVAVVLDVRGGRIKNTTDYREIPDTFHGMPMVDGDMNDDRSTDPAGVVVGLRAKGRMLKLAMAKPAIA